MRKRTPGMACIALAIMMFFCAGTASALSSMPNGEGNPWPSVMVFFTVIALFVSGFIVSDRLTRRIVNRMRKDNDIDGLIGALRNAWLARKAACALGDIKDEKAIEPLVEALHDKNGDVRQAAAKALGDIGDQRAADALRQALDDEFAGVRECASYALQKMAKSGNSF